MGTHGADDVKQEKNIGHRWQPGESGNPNGRPRKGFAMTDIMRQMLDENGNISKAIMSKLLQMAASGDMAAIREVLDRLEGKPLQSTDITSLGDKIEGRVIIDTHAPESSP